MNMRHKLRNSEGQRKRFSATFERFGEKRGFRGNTIRTLLLKDVRDESGKIVTDHIWFDYTSGFKKIVLKQGITIGFDARVKEYLKGYVNHREFVDERQFDLKLSHPTKIELIENIVKTD